MQRPPRLQWLKFSAMLLVLGAFISILIYVLIAKDELTATAVDVPLITAADTPVKRRPENPGGLDIPNRDRVVFDLLATAEQATASAKAATAAPEPAISLTPVEVAPVVKSATEQAFAPVVVDTPAEVDAIASLLEATPAAKPAAPKVVTPAKVEPAETLTEKVVAEAVKGSGSFGVQLASFAQESDAKTAAKRYADKFKGDLANMNADIQRADLGAKGVRYRVRFIGSATKAAANTLCKQLKTQGQGCFAVSK